MEWHRHVIKNLKSLPPQQSWRPADEEHPDCLVMTGVAIRMGEIEVALKSLEARNNPLRMHYIQSASAPIAEGGHVDIP